MKWEQLSMANQEKKDDMFSNISKKKTVLSDEEVLEVVDDASLVTKPVKKKAGRPRSKIIREQTMLSLSAYQEKQFDTALGLLMINGIKIKRGRSETAELAIRVLNTLLQNDATKAQAMTIVEQYHNYEENDPLLK